MELMTENRKCKQRCSCSSCRMLRYRCLYLTVLLLVCAASVCGVMRFRQRRYADVKQSADCSDRHLRDQEEAYDMYKRRHANLKILQLTERDGAPFLQSRQPAPPRDITIVTQTSLDRWPQLERMATAWGGALCAAVHVRTRSEIVAARKKMMWLHDLIEAQHHCRLHLQLVMEEGFKSEADLLTAAYPVNALRNVALDMAKTELVFVLDADFVPSPGLHERLTMNETVYSDLLNRTRMGGQLLVVPAFQAQPFVPRGIPAASVSAGQQPVPQDMQELRVQWLNSSANMFRYYHPISHDASSYSHFLHPLTTEPYLVQYRELYEPYFIAARTGIPRYDDRFRGYGKNKISHAYQCVLQGFNFVVLPQVYVWESPHPKTENSIRFIAEKNGDPCHTTIMDMVYKDFKQEVRREVQQAEASLNSNQG